MAFRKLMVLAVFFAALLPAAEDVQVYTIDVSVSNRDAAATIIQEVNDVLAHLPDGQRFRIYAIAGDLRLVAGGRAEPADRAEARRSLEALKFNGQKTDLEAAIAVPIQTLKASGYQIAAYVIWTDGMNDPQAPAKHRTFAGILADPEILPDDVPLTVRLCMGSVLGSPARRNVHVIQSAPPPLSARPSAAVPPRDLPRPHRVTGGLIFFIAGIFMILALGWVAYLSLRSRPDESGARTPRPRLQFLVKAGDQSVYLSSDNRRAVLSDGVGLGSDILFGVPGVRIELEHDNRLNAVWVFNAGQVNVLVSGRTLKPGARLKIRALATLAMAGEVAHIVPVVADERNPPTTVQGWRVSA